MRILITGITGFVGSHLAEYCLTQPDTKVYGAALSYNLAHGLKRIEHIKDKIELLECNFNNRIEVDRVIRKSKPDKIFHLVAQSSVLASWQSAKDTLFNNIISELNLFEAVREMGINPVIVISCSSEEYGLVFENELPIKEINPLRPLSPYAVSKIAQEKLAFQYHQSYNFKTVLTRFFNTEGPRRDQDFVISNFAKQIVEIERSKREPVIYVGNLEAKRDFSDVRDMVRAYWLASEKCKFGEPYNVCSEKARSIKSILDLLLRLSKVKNIKVKQDPKRMRFSDALVIVGDCSKFKRQTGWEPKIDFKGTLKDTLEYWREEI